jgi:hypothetical protein
LSQLSSLARLTISLFNLRPSTGANAVPNADLSALSSLQALRDLWIYSAVAMPHTLAMRELNLLTQITSLSLTSDAYGKDLTVAEALPTRWPG